MTTYDMYLEAKERNAVKPFEGDFYTILKEYAEKRWEAQLSFSELNAIDYIAGYTYNKTISLIELIEVINRLKKEGVIDA